MDWTRKHLSRVQAPTPSSETDLPVRQKSNASEGCNSAVKPVVSKVVELRKKEARKHRSDSKPNDSEMPVDISVKQPNKGLTGYWIIVLGVMK